MSRPLWVLAAGLALLFATATAVWGENHKPWQAWQERYNAEAGVTPVPVKVQVLVPMQTGKPELCLTCHIGIEDISPSHPAQAIGCVVCHGGDPLALDADRAHATLRGNGNPSDPSVVQESCGHPNCHAGYADEERNHVDRVLKSLQATYAGAIAAVRFAFGQQATPTAEYGVRAAQDASAPLPAKAVPSLQALASAAGGNAAVDRFPLACLNGGCHLGAPAQAQPYYYRGTGCAACHYLYDDDGLYKGNDPTIPRDQPGHGAVHRLTTAIPYNQCDHCHNRGTYSLKEMSFMPRDDLPPVAAPLSPHMPPEGRRLIEYYQPIATFSKCEVELDCVDCHTAQEAMGDGHIYGSKKDAEYIQCQTCHGTPTAGPAVATISAADETAMRQARINGRADFLKVGDKVIQTARGELLWSVKQTGPNEFTQIDKVNGKTYRVPLVMGSKCTQDGKTQTSDYCHQCHAVQR